MIEQSCSLQPLGMHHLWPDIYCLNLDFSPLEQEGVIEIVNDKHVAKMLLSSTPAPRADITNQLPHSPTRSSVSNIAQHRPSPTDQNYFGPHQYSWPQSRSTCHRCYLSGGFRNYPVDYSHMLRIGNGDKFNEAAKMTVIWERESKLTP